MGIPRIIPWSGLLVLLAVTSHSRAAGVKEYCQFDSFEGRCAVDEVILIKTAQYGRMRAGKCISGEGYIGCQADVITYLDSLCSGRHSCKVDVTEIRDVAQPCKKDFTSYLEVSYECIKVSKGKSNMCRHSHDVQLEAGAGYIATLTTTETGLGTQDCPWLLQATGGQRVSLTVLDFGTVVKDEADKWVHTSYNALNCPVHLVVMDGSARSQTPLCGAGNRQRHLLTSKENRVKMHVTMQMSQGSIPHFLLQYKVTGCPDIRTPTGAYITRDGDNAVVRCNSTQETWYITCDGQKWIGDLGNCSGGSWGLHKFFGTRIPVTQGILIAVAIGVALGIVFGSTLLASVLFCRRKCRPTHHHVEQDSDDVIDRDHQSNYPSLLKHGGGGGVDPRRGVGGGGSTHPSPAAAAAAGKGTGTGPTSRLPGEFVGEDPGLPPPPHNLPYDLHYGPRRSHIYECPAPPKRADDHHHGHHGADPPVYFDLDPETPRYKSGRGGKPL